VYFKIPKQSHTYLLVIIVKKKIAGTECSTATLHTWVYIQSDNASAETDKYRKLTNQNYPVGNGKPYVRMIQKGSHVVAVRGTKLWPTSKCTSSVMDIYMSHESPADAVRVAKDDYAKKKLRGVVLSAIGQRRI
jgi:hypothetical protein